jgi:hypothetical protein
MKWENNVRMVLREGHSEDRRGLVGLARDRVQWRAWVLALLNPCVMLPWRQLSWFFEVDSIGYIHNEVFELIMIFKANFPSDFLKVCKLSYYSLFIN